MSDTPYLFKCGVLHRLFSLGFCQNLVVDNRNSSTLSFGQTLTPEQVNCGKYYFMKKTGLLLLFFALCLEGFCSNSEFKPEKRIYLWDVTLSMKGYEGKTPDIYDEVLKFLIGDIQKVVDPSTTIVICPFQDRNGVLATFETKATKEGVSKLVKSIKNYQNDNITSTDIIGAIDYARKHLIRANESTMLYILTDGKQSKKFGGMAALIQEINDLSIETYNFDCFTLYYMLTKEAEDRGLIEVIDGKDNIGIVGPGEYENNPLQICITTKNIPVNIKDDSTVSICFSTKTEAEIPNKIKISISASENNYLSVDGEYEIKDNKIVVPLHFLKDYSELKNILGEKTDLKMNVKLITDKVDKQRIIMTSNNVGITLINKPEKTLKIKIK